MKKSCKICDVEFESKRKDTDCCSKTCRNRKYILKYKERDWFIDAKKRAKNKLYDLYKEKSLEWGIPTHWIQEYGVNFLIENKEALEILQISFKIIGRKNDFSEARKAIVKKELSRAYYQRLKQKAEAEGLTKKNRLRFNQFFFDWLEENKDKI